MAQTIPPQIAFLFNKIKNKYNTFHRISPQKKVVGHSISIGLPGAGKTTCNRVEAELRYEINHKLIMLYDAGRMDLAYMMFPSNSPFWKVPKKEGHRIIGSRGYKTELLYPVTKHVPKKIPNNARLFTIPVVDLDEDDISAMTGSSSLEGIKAVLNAMEEKVTKKTTGHDYLNILGQMLKRTEDADNIKISHHGTKSLKGKVFLPLLNEGILSSKDCETALNIDEILKDKKTITVLVLKHCPMKLWGFIVHYFMNHVFKRLSGVDGRKRIKRNTTIVANEVQDILEQTGDMGESALAISRAISKIARQSRTANLFLLMDTQLPQRLPDVKDIIHRLYVFNSGRIEVEKALEIMGVGLKTGMISMEELSLISWLPPGWYYLIDKQKGVSFHKLRWTRSRTYLDGEDFYDIYNHVYGRMAYQDITEILKRVRENAKRSEESWRNVNKFTNEKEKGESVKQIEQIEDIGVQQEMELKQEETPLKSSIEKERDKKLPTDDELMKMIQSGAI